MSTEIVPPIVVDEELYKYIICDVIPIRKRRPEIKKVIYSVKNSDFEIIYRVVDYFLKIWNEMYLKEILMSICIKNIVGIYVCDVFMEIVLCNAESDSFNTHHRIFASKIIGKQFDKMLPLSRMTYFEYLKRYNLYSGYEDFPVDSSYVDSYLRVSIIVPDYYTKVSFVSEEMHKLRRETELEKYMLSVISIYKKDFMTRRRFRKIHSNYDIFKKLQFLNTDIYYSAIYKTIYRCIYANKLIDCDLSDFCDIIDLTLLESKNIAWSKYVREINFVNFVCKTYKKICNVEILMIIGTMLFKHYSNYKEACEPPIILDREYEKWKKKMIECGLYYEKIY